MPTTTAGTSLGPAALQSAVDGVHRAGMPGVYAEVRDAGQVWRGASGVADVETGRPVTPDMRQVEKGRIQLDAPIGRYLPRLVPGARYNRFRQFHPAELIEMGLMAPAAGEPGGALGVYSNTNYLFLGQLLEQVTGTTAEKCVTRDKRQAMCGDSDDHR